MLYAWRYSSPLSKKPMGCGRSYAAGGPREAQANNGDWWTGSKSAAGASQATRMIGATLAATVVCRKGNGPTWHSRQQWSDAWCDSSWQAKAKDCPQSVRHTSNSTSSILTRSGPSPAGWAGLPLSNRGTRILWLRNPMRFRLAGILWGRRPRPQAGLQTRCWSVRMRRAGPGGPRRPGGPPHCDPLQRLFLGDNLLHDFRSPGADGVQPQIAPIAADGVFGGVAETAENLHAVVTQALRQLGCVQLGHGDLANRLLPAISQVERAVDQPAGGLHVGTVFGKLMAPDLITAHGIPECLTLLAVLNG